MRHINFESYHQLDFRSNEAYISLRTNLLFCGNNIKLVCFTSCLPNEGKSNVSFHLAVSIAESGKKVLFVDADLRKSVIIGRYKPDRAVLGLTHYLSGQNEMEDIRYTTNMKNLDIILSGPVSPNPSELLGSDYFLELLKSMRNEYDYVIIDTPPLASVIDSVIVSEQCDGVVLIIETNAISYKLAQRVKKQLEKGNCKILGAVLNKVNLSDRLYGHYKKKYRRYENDYKSNSISDE
jgi:capsular exopolysaccharide synthesis family protein